MSGEKQRKISELKSIPDSKTRICFNETRNKESMAALAETHANRLLNINNENLKELTGRELERINGDLSGFKQSATWLKFSIDKERSQIETEIRNLNNTLAELEKGIKSYDSKLVALRDVIKKELKVKHGREIPVFILADLLEIRDMRWRNAVEAYLHTQKFYLLVDPQYFIDALKVYDRLKFTMGFYDWGIVDTGKLERYKPRPEKRSLAEEVVTEHAYARMFVDYVMGRVIKCDKVET